MRVALATDSTMTSALATLTTSQVSHGVTRYRHLAPPLHKVRQGLASTRVMVARRSPMVEDSPGPLGEPAESKNLVFPLGRGDDFVLRIEDDGFSTKRRHGALHQESRAAFDARNVHATLEDQRDRTGVVGDDAAQFGHATLVADRHGANASGDLHELSFRHATDRRGVTRTCAKLRVRFEVRVLAQTSTRDLVAHGFLREFSLGDPTAQRAVRDDRRRRARYV